MACAEGKKRLRTEVRGAERRISPAEREASNKKISCGVLALPEYRAARCVCCFVGTSREIDTTAILNDVLASGKTLCVPLCLGPGRMELRRIRSLAQLRPGAYGILEPEPDTPEIPLEQVDFSLVPCVSCNHEGDRLGQGGGYYDRFFASGTERAALLCRELLIRAQIPREPHDLTFPIVITEAGAYRRGTLVPTASV